MRTDLSLGRGVGWLNGIFVIRVAVGGVRIVRREADQL